MVTMLDMLLEYGTEVVEKVTMEVKDKIADRGAEIKKTKVCKVCCCNSHNCHVKTALDKNTELVKKFFPNLMARPWLEQLDDYKAELLDNVPVSQDKHVFLLIITNMDLKGDVVEDEIASADKFTVLEPCTRQFEANFQGESIVYSFAPLKSLCIGTTYTASERRRC